MMTNTRALQLARDAYRGSTDYWDANIRAQVEKDIRAFQGRHSSDSKYSAESYKGRSKLYRPKTRSTIRKNEAIACEAFFSTIDAVSVTAEDERDDAQQASADVMKSLLEYRLKKTIPWFQTVMGAYQDAQTVGVVISHQHWKYDAVRKIDTPVVDLLPVENFRFDPAASWIDPVGTSPYLIQLIPMYIKDVKRRMRAGADGTPAKWLPLQDAQIKSAVRHYDSTRLLREDNRTDSRDASTAITEFTVVWVHRVIVEDEGVDQIYYTLGTEFLLSAPVPLSTEYAHGRRPYVIGVSIIETHKPYPAGVPRISRDVQTEINEVANQRIDNVKFAMNKRYFVKRNKQVDIRSITRNVPGSVTMLTDPDGDVKIVDTPDVTASSYQEQDRLNLDFDDVTGTFSNGSVQSNRRLNETVGGMGILTDNANQVSGYQLKTFVETWAEPVLRQLLWLERDYETDERILALAGKAAAASMQRAGLDAVTDQMLREDMTLTVNIGQGATSPTQRINNLITGVRGVKEALADGALEKYGVEPSEIIKEVFGALGHKDGGRFFKAGEEDPAVAGLKQQVSQLQQQLEQKQPQALIDAQIRKLDAETRYIEAQKVAKGNEAIYSSMQTAEVIASVPQVAPIADKIMQAAGYVVPTPTGVDPDFPVNAQQAGGAPGLDPNLTGAAEAPPGDQGPGIVPAAVEAAQSGPIDLPPSGNTSPMFPARAANPAAGAQQGIETQRADGA